MQPRTKVIVIVGPTASGKSDLAIALAQKFNGEIISADSRQVYRGMDIGTGKVERDKLLGSSFQLLEEGERISKSYKLTASVYYSAGTRHHLLDTADPKRDFSVARYQRLGRKAIQDISRRGKVPIIVGGTGLYVDALVYDMNLPSVPPNKHLRAKLEKQSTEHLFKQLQKLDPSRAATIDRHNPRRLIRALEIVITTGSPVPALPKSSSLKAKSYNVLWLGITWPKEKLEERIAIRLAKRFKQGMIAEVKRLHGQGVSWKRLESFGLEYRSIATYLQSKSKDYKLKAISYQTMHEALLRDIVRYSKRQMTWFKRNQAIHWITNQNEARRLVQTFLG